MKEIGLKQFMRVIQIVFFVIFSPCLIAQEGASSDFNLPPNVVLSKKFDPNEMDLSRVLNELKHQRISPSDYKVNAKFIKPGLTDEDWSNMEEDNPDEFAYYREAKAFYDRLSPRVKHILNTEELWFIYMFKREIRNQLTEY